MVDEEMHLDEPLRTVTRTLDAPVLSPPSSGSTAAADDLVPAVRIVGLTKRFDGNDTAAVDNVSLAVTRGTIFTLLGSSGSGKSTTLRCIAGLEQPDAGEIYVGESLVSSGVRGVNVPPHRRDLGMVFQSYAIWPHMTVRQNVAYPLTNQRKVSKDEIDGAVATALRLVNMDRFIDRPAPLLSGGEQQRVALARALAQRPEVLLLDEPLSNLDARLREEMRLELRDLQRRLGLTMIYVTHDQEEAFSLSDIMAVMSHGRVMELDIPEKIYRTPRTEFGAEFLGTTTRLDGTVVRRLDADAAIVGTAIGELRCRTSSPIGENAAVSVYIRPEELNLDRESAGPQGPDEFRATIERVAFLGGSVDWWASINGVSVRGRLVGDGVLTEASVGQHVVVGVSGASCLPMASPN